MLGEGKCCGLRIRWVTTCTKTEEKNRLQQRTYGRSCATNIGIRPSRPAIENILMSFNVIGWGKDCFAAFLGKSTFHVHLEKKHCSTSLTACDSGGRDFLAETVIGTLSLLFFGTIVFHQGRECVLTETKHFCSSAVCFAAGHRKIYIQMMVEDLT